MFSVVDSGSPHVVAIAGATLSSFSSLCLSRLCDFAPLRLCVISGGHYLKIRVFSLNNSIVPIRETPRREGAKAQRMNYEVERAHVG